MARILVVEDQADVLEVVIELLRNGDHEPVGVATLTDAIPLLQNEKWHVVLADLLLPDGDGREVCQEANKVQIPCGLMTGDYGLFDELQAAGIPFLPKPFREAALSSFLRPLLGSPPA